MSGYILSILGIVIAGVVIDVIIPTGEINKYIKSLYSVFVVAVILMPVINLVKDYKDIRVNYSDYETNELLLNYINNQKVKSLEEKIVAELNKEGFNNISIKINFSLKDDNLTLNSCFVDLKNLSSSTEVEHNNKYEFISNIIKEHTNLTDEVIIFNE